MDQMIEILKTELQRNKVSLDEPQWEMVASYLVGQTPIDHIIGFFPKKSSRSSSYIYYSSNRDIAEIAAACKDEPVLLQRLGRYLLLLSYYGKDYCREFVGKLRQSDQPRKFTLKEIFLDSGFGASALLHYMFDDSKRVLSETAQVLDIIYRDSRDELEGYILQNPAPYRTIPLAFYCAKVPREEKKLLKNGVSRWHAMLESDMILSLMSLYKAANFGGKGNQEEIQTSLMDQFPTAFKGYKAEEAKAGGAFESAGLKAMYITGFTLEEPLKIAKVFFEIRSSILIEKLSEILSGYLHININLHNAYFSTYHMTAEECRESMVQQLSTLEEWLREMGCDPAALCAWSAGKMAYSPLKWEGVFSAVYGDKPALLKDAVPYGTPIAAAMLCRMLYDMTGEAFPDELLPRCVSQLLNVPENGGKEAVQQVIDYILSDKEQDVSKLPGLTEAYLNSGNKYRPFRMNTRAVDYALWTMAGINEAPARYLNFLAYNLYSLHIAEFVDFQVEQYQKPAEWTAQYLQEHVMINQTVYCLAVERNENCKKVLNILLQTHPEAAVWALGQKSMDADTRLFLLETLYTQIPDYDEDYLLSCLGDKSKKVREYAISFLIPKKHLLEKVKVLTEAKKKDVREAAERLMISYEGEQANTSGEADDIVGFCMRNLPKNAKTSIKWAFSGDVPAVRWEESKDKADESVVLFYLHSILTSKIMEYPTGTQKMRTLLCEEDLHQIAKNVFNTWLNENAPAKTKGALLLMGIHADNTDIPLIQKQIDSWAQNSRSAIAADAVWALALGGSDLALMAVDSMGQKYKNKQVRRAGQEAFAAAAKILGTTPEILGDRIVPTLGFDERGELTIDYGPRQFTALLSPSMTIALKDMTGKTIKSLPKPGAKDDAEVAEKSKAAFTALKKSLKTVVGLQGTRLEQALSTGRRWSKDAWEKLFVKNPIMHNFAISLVWGAYEGDTLGTSFRYMEDGSFTDVNEDDFAWEDLAEAEIGLVHPLDLGKELTDAWQEQLGDYDIVQPISQLSRAVYLRDPKEESALTVDLFCGKKMLGITLINKLQKLGWYKGSVQDAGCFYSFYKETAGVGMQMVFSGMYVSPDLDEVITIGQAAFYKAGSIERGSYVYDEIDMERLIRPKDVSARMYSELVYDLTVATASSVETDEKWASDGCLDIIRKK